MSVVWSRPFEMLSITFCRKYFYTFILLDSFILDFLRLFCLEIDLNKLYKDLHIIRGKYPELFEEYKGTQVKKEVIINILQLLLNL